jgi:hypothetical protein
MGLRRPLRLRQFASKVAASAPFCFAGIAQRERWRRAHNSHHTLRKWASERALALARHNILVIKWKVASFNVALIRYVHSVRGTARIRATLQIHTTPSAIETRKSKIRDEHNTPNHFASMIGPFKNKTNPTSKVPPHALYWQLCLC